MLEAVDDRLRADSRSSGSIRAVAAQLMYMTSVLGAARSSYHADRYNGKDCPQSPVARCGINDPSESSRWMVSALGHGHLYQHDIPTQDQDPMVGMLGD